jgi:hypothetical protein
MAPCDLQVHGGAQLQGLPVGACAPQHRGPEPGPQRQRARQRRQPRRCSAVQWRPSQGRSQARRPPEKVDRQEAWPLVRCGAWGASVSAHVASISSGAHAWLQSQGVAAGDTFMARLLQVARGAAAVSTCARSMARALCGASSATGSSRRCTTRLPACRQTVVARCRCRMPSRRTAASTARRCALHPLLQQISITKYAGYLMDALMRRITMVANMNAVDASDISPSGALHMFRTCR